MGILESALIVTGLILYSKPKKKRRRQRKKLTRQKIKERRWKALMEDRKLTVKAGEDFAKAMNDSID